MAVDEDKDDDAGRMMVLMDLYPSLDSTSVILISVPQMFKEIVPSCLSNSVEALNGLREERDSCGGSKCLHALEHVRPFVE